MIIATAGHVDHGKTSLIKQLTGVDTDRLEEEKRRGLSINLGFAFLPAEGSNIIGFIDVPGHQRFINTMIAGVSSIDFGMLVIAADDGPMPQTREHLDVMTLLGIKKFLIVISKIDKTDKAQIKTVRSSILSLLPEGIDQAPPVFEVSNITAEGIDLLRQHIDQLALSHQSKTVVGFFRLSIDRTFLLKGAGLIVTGTVTCGEISVGDNVQLLPGGVTLRVRSIHAQDKPSKKGQAGQRCALNLVGNIEKDAIKRGDWLLGEGALGSTNCFAARVELLASSPVSIKHMSPLKLYLGAKHIAAKIILLEREKTKNTLLPGKDCLVQIITSEPVCCHRGERFLLRDDSESFTLGGGMVLDPQAQRLRKLQPQHLVFLTAMEMPNFAHSIQYLLLDQQQVINFSAFKQSWNLGSNEADKILETAGIMQQLCLLEIDQNCFALSKLYYLTLEQTVIKSVDEWHLTHPETAGIKSGELKNQLKSTDCIIIFHALLSELLNQEKLTLAGGLLQTPNFTSTVSSQDQQQWQRINEILENRGPVIPLLSELSTESELSMQQVSTTVLSATKSGHLYKVSDKRFGLGKTLLALTAQVNNLAQRQTEFSAVEFKNQVGIGRNYAIELLEYFDSIRFTQRRGNERIVLDPKRPENLFK